MMTNKEKLEQLSEQIKKLTALTEEISERDIYPVSFFSQAYDITNTILEELRQIEIAQIELFEKQMKEHQAQILSIVPQQEYPGKQENTEKQGKPEKEEMLTEPGEHVQAPLPEAPPDVIPLTPLKKEILDSLPQTPLQQEIDTPAIIPSPISPVSPASPIPSVSPLKKDDVGKTARIDLKKVITLNDRFLFCRELFSNDENRMSRTIADLNKEETFEASMDYLRKHFDWNVDDDHVADFIGCLKKSFIN